MEKENSIILILNILKESPMLTILAFILVIGCGLGIFYLITKILLQLKGAKIGIAGQTIELNSDKKENKETSSESITNEKKQIEIPMKTLKILLHNCEDNYEIYMNRKEDIEARMLERQTYFYKEAFRTVIDNLKIKIAEDITNKDKLLKNETNNEFSVAKMNYLYLCLNQDFQEELSPLFKEVEKDTSANFATLNVSEKAQEMSNQFIIRVKNRLNQYPIFFDPIILIGIFDSFKTSIKEVIEKAINKILKNKEENQKQLSEELEEVKAKNQEEIERIRELWNQ